MPNIAALFVASLVLFGVSGVAVAQPSPKRALRFAPGKPFKIVQFSDPQDDEQMDPRTIVGMCRILDREKPDLVVVTGDLVSTGDVANLQELKVAIGHVAKPMEDRRIPWAVTFGNHDLDGIGKIGISSQEMMNLYRAYEHNITPLDPVGVYGAGNGLLRILGSNGKPAFGVWLLDSNAYAPGQVGGQKLGGYDWIRSSQIAWYVRESNAVERQIGKKLPSIMFFHICLPEYALLAATKNFTGERNEDECPSQINSGLFAALLDRGDVRGVYVGHDHVNTYEGSWYGIRLGYGGNIGYGTYGLPGNETERNRLRGARVFTITESNPENYQSSYVLVSGNS